MFVQAGVVSLAMLLASRLLGLVRESAQAAAFGTTGLGDLVVLMLTLPDWLTGVVASGALAYVLVPAWATASPQQVAVSQARVGRGLMLLGLPLALGLVLLRDSAVAWLAAGVPAALVPTAALALVWSACAIPLALLASLWATRLQHERDFLGLYASSLVVNGVLIAAIVLAGWQSSTDLVVNFLGAGLLAAMALRLVWQAWRHPRRSPHPMGALSVLPLPSTSVWAWAMVSAGLPLALPFVARSLASLQGEGALAAFNYAWKLVELPLILAIQLVATLAFPAVAAAVSRGLTSDSARAPVRVAFALAWALACACAAGLWVGADAVSQMLFGWGRMDPAALLQVAAWGRVGAWSLLPQAVTAVALTVLASQGRLRPAALAYALALAALGAVGVLAQADGAALMGVLNLLFVAIAVAVVLSLGRGALACIPWAAMAWPAAVLLAVSAASQSYGVLPQMHPAMGLTLAALAAALVLAAAWLGAGPLREGLRR